MKIHMRAWLAWRVRQQWDKWNAIGDGKDSHIAGGRIAIILAFFGALLAGAREVLRTFKDVSEAAEVARKVGMGRPTDWDWVAHVLDWVTTDPSRSILAADVVLLAGIVLFEACHWQRWTLSGIFHVASKTSVATKRLDLAVRTPHAERDLRLAQLLRNLHHDDARRLGGHLLKIHDHPEWDLPVALFVWPESQELSCLNSNLGSLPNAKLLVDRDTGLQSFREQLASLNNAGATPGYLPRQLSRILCMKELHLEKNGWSINPACASYEEIQESSETREEAWLLARVLDLASVPEATSLLRFRARICAAEDRTLGALGGGYHRAAGFGISALTVFRTKTGWACHVKLRSDLVGEYKNCWHVVPSGMLSTFDSKLLSDDIERRLAIEFAEELFDHKISQEDHDLPSEARCMLADEMKKLYLFGTDNKYRARILLTGVSVDLLNLRPEFSTLVIIDSEKWDSEMSRRPNWEGHLRQVTLEKNMDLVRLLREKNWMTPSATVPNGAAAFVLGVNAFCRLQGWDALLPLPVNR